VLEWHSRQSRLTDELLTATLRQAIALEDCIPSIVSLRVSKR
jgi:hypothetical protein